ncbi:MAG: hypothetical protein WC708_13235 [Lentisphaeria bacterium]
MKFFFVFLWVLAFLGNFCLVFMMGLGHSSVLADKGLCLFNPLCWIGQNLGLCSSGTFGGFFLPLLWFWIGVLVLGLQLPQMRGKLSPLWAFLLIPALSGFAWWMTSFWGWSFG